MLLREDEQGHTENHDYVFLVVIIIACASKTLSKTHHTSYGLKAYRTW